MCEGERDLETLLRTLRPVLRPGKWVFEARDPSSPVPRAAALVFLEEEAKTLVLPADVPAQGPRSAPFAWITCEVWSSLEAVGMLAAISRSLAESGIAVNVVSAYYHDHLFVPYESRERAVAALEALGTS